MESTLIHSGYLSGCIGRITAMHADCYHKLAGFGLPLEAKVARELAAFCERFEAGRDGLWLALGPDGAVNGSIAIDGLHARGADGAHLRWFIVSEAIRGTGAGHALMAAAMGFCRDRGYTRAHLWTFDGLHAARHLYEKAGFHLALQRRGAQWGKEVDEQRFEWRA